MGVPHLGYDAWANGAEKNEKESDLEVLRARSGKSAKVEGSKPETNGPPKLATNSFSVCPAGRDGYLFVLQALTGVVNRPSMVVLAF